MTLPSRCVLLAIAALVAHSAAFTCAQTSADVLVQRLGDADAAERASATDGLLSAGEAARAALQSASKSADPEISARAKRLLRGMPPADPAPLADPQPVIRYRDANELDRLRLITETTGPELLSLLVRWWGIERKPDVRQVIFRRMQENLSASASALLADANPVTAQVLLEESIRNEMPGAVEAYAAVALCRGNLNAVIARWSARGEKSPPDRIAQHVLAVLYRARGDFRAAKQFASHADDSLLLESILLAAGDWQGLGTSMRRRRDSPQRAAELAMLGAVDHLAGNTAACNDDVRAMIAKITDDNEAAIAANALLLCGNPDQALRVFHDHHQWSAAFEVMAGRGQFDQAFELLASRQDDDSAAAMLLRIAGAKLAHQLGDAKQVDELLSAVAQRTQSADKSQVFVALAQEERECGRTDAAWEHLAEAYAVAPDDSPLLWQLGSVFLGREDDLDWNGIWHLLLEIDPGAKRKQIFARLRSIYDRTISIDELRALSRWNGHGPVRAPARSQLALEAARRIADGGDRNTAQNVVEAEARNTESPLIFQHLGDLAAEGKDWQQAAQWYQLAWQADRSQPLPLYLRGHALAEAGDVALAREADRLARSLSLADAWQRYRVTRALEARQFDEALAGEAEILRRTAPPMSVGSDVAARLAAEQAKNRGDYATEISLLHAMTVHLSAGAYRFRDPIAYLALPYRLHLAAALMALSSADDMAMNREIQACRDLVPDDITLAIELVPELEKHGHKAEAEDLFNQSLQTQQNLCDRYPQSAARHNQVAWLAAECGRELDNALSHARRAVELEPTKTAYLDTLAETHFKRGEYDDAITQIKKCIALEPKVRRHREQLEKFQSPALHAAKK